jgi:hypothetical protein
MSNIVLINGVQYQKNEPKQKQKPSRARGMMMQMAMMAYSGYIEYAGASSYNRQRPAVDIVKEYELIQQKKLN